MKTHVQRKIEEISYDKKSIVYSTCLMFNECTLYSIQLMSKFNFSESLKMAEKYGFGMFKVDN